MKNGISVVICTYNGSERLKPVLVHLAEQKIERDIEWEILLVDNNSIDNTSNIAREIWDALPCEAPLKIFLEKNPGTMHARRRGVFEASFDILIYCDDDNWFDPEYLQKAYDLMRLQGSIAGAGGEAIATFPFEKPDWFDMYKNFYACGTQGTVEGIIENKGALFTAGLVLRRQILLDIFKAGFSNQLQGRSAMSMVAGEDMELTYFMSIVGYKFWYSPELKFYHFMDERRLNRSYLRKLVEGIGVSKALLNPYEIVYHGDEGKFSSSRLGQIIKFAVKHVYILVFNPFKRERSLELLRNQKTIETLMAMGSRHKEEVKRIIILGKMYNEKSGRST